MIEKGHNNNNLSTSPPSSSVPCLQSVLPLHEIILFYIEEKRKKERKNPNYLTETVKHHFPFLPLITIRFASLDLHTPQSTIHTHKHRERDRRRGRGSLSLLMLSNPNAICFLLLLCQCSDSSFLFLIFDSFLAFL